MNATRRLLAQQLVEAVATIRGVSYRWSKIEQGDDRKFRVLLNHAGDDISHAVQALRGEQ